MRTSHFNSLSPFVKIVDELLTRTFHDQSGGQLWKNNTPGLNVNELENEIVLDLAAPGLEKKDFKIEIENNSLILSADKKQETNESNNNFSRREFSYHTFKRIFEIPSNLDTEKIIANYENGILSIRIPKIEKVKKNIQIIDIV